jgi:hypothetical protein
MIKPGFKLHPSKRYLRQSRHKQEQDGSGRYWDTKKRLNIASINPYKMETMLEDEGNETSLL